MLPRLIIAVLVVNLSLYICQLAIDLSNILGKSLYDVFMGLSTSFCDKGCTPGSAPAPWNLGSGIVAAIAVAGAAVYVVAGISLPVLLAVLCAVLMTLLILAFRQAAILILLVISPLAFVAYLLPNTENLFKQWGKMFLGLLMVYPIIGVVFGGSTLAANIIATTNGDWQQQLVAIAIAGLPLFLTPSLLKNAMSATGKMGEKLSGWATTANGRYFTKRKETSYSGQWNAARIRNAQIRRAQRFAGEYRGRNPIGRRANSWYKWLNSRGITGQPGTTVGQQGAAGLKKLELEDIDAAQAQMANLRAADLTTIAHGGHASGINGSNTTAHVAAMAELLTRGDFQGLESAYNNLYQTNSPQNVAARRKFGQYLSASNDRPFFMGHGITTAMITDDYSGVGGQAAAGSLRTVANSGLGRASAAVVAARPAEELMYAAGAETARDARGNTIITSLGNNGANLNTPGGQSFRTAAGEAQNNENIGPNIGRNRDIIEHIAHYSGGNHGPQPPAGGGNPGNPPHQPPPGGNQPPAGGGGNNQQPPTIIIPHNGWWGGNYH